MLRSQRRSISRRCKPFSQPAAHAVLPAQVKFEAVQAKMASDGQRFQSAIAAYNLMNTALDRRFGKLAKVWLRMGSFSVCRRCQRGGWTYMCVCGVVWAVGPWVCSRG
jgi:hypothetical protein